MSVDRVNFEEVMKFRAVQAAFPPVQGERISEPTQSGPVILSIDTPDRVSAIPLCAQACIFNPNTQNSDLLKIPGFKANRIMCTGIQADKPAVLNLEDPSQAKEVVSVAPCGLSIDKASPTLWLKLEPKAQLKKHQWYDLLGRFIDHINRDYTANPDLLNSDDILFLNDNNEKHTHSLKLALASLGSISSGLLMAHSDSLNQLVLQGSFGSMAVFGGAWFAISMANIRSEFARAGITTTRNMLIPLEISMASTLSALASASLDHGWVTPLIMLPFMLAFERGIEAVVQYDTSDAFNRGLTGETQDYYTKQNAVMAAIGITPNMSIQEMRRVLQIWRVGGENLPTPHI